MDLSPLSPRQFKDGKIRPKKYAELTKQERLQDDCDVQVTNIVLQGLPLDKELFLYNDQRLDRIICQDVINIVMHVDSVPVNMLSADNKCLMNDNLEIKRLEQENDHLFELFLIQEIVHICVNCLASRKDCHEMQQGFIHEYNANLMLKAELAKKGHMVENKIFDEVIRKRPECKDYGLWKLSDGKSNNFSSLLMEGLGHNLFSVSQFRDSDLEVKASNTPTNPKLKTQFKKSGLCYPTNDSEDLGKLKPKVDIGIFIGLGPQLLTPRTTSSGLVPNPPSPTLYVPLTKKDGDILFQPMFDEYLNPPPSVAFPVHAIIAPEPADSPNPPSSKYLLIKMHTSPILHKPLKEKS
ncbi:hypothetical protein Tco_1285735 [Tanacetum coccineum]